MHAFTALACFGANSISLFRLFECTWAVSNLSVGADLTLVVLPPVCPRPPYPSPSAVPSRHFIVALLLSSLSGRQQCLLSLDGGKVHISRTDQELRPALSCIIGWKASLSSFCITRPSQTGCTGICLVFSRRWISNKISAKDFARHDPSTLLATHTVQSVSKTRNHFPRVLS